MNSNRNHLQSIKTFYTTTVPSDWDTPEFGKEFYFLKTFSHSREQLTSKKTEDEIYNIHYGDIHATFKNKIVDFEIEEFIPFLADGLIREESIRNSEFPALKDGDLIIADVSEDYAGICGCIELKNVNGRKVIGGLHTFAARANESSIALGFRAYVLSHQQVIRELRRIVTGTSVNGISKIGLSKLKIALPPLAEQKAIAHILSLMDSSITSNNLLITQKELRKKWMVQNLLTGKIRLTGYTKDWENKTLKKLVTPVKRALNPIQDELYQQIGIRSHGKGLFYKEKVTGAALGNKSVFWVEPNCFIANIVFAWEHAVAKTTEAETGMIASHRFPMFKPKEGVLHLDYLLYFFKSSRGKQLLELASPGGAGRNKTLGQSEFLKLNIPVPSYEEQTAIAQVLLAVDKELQLLKAKTEKLKEQKKGMMQVLLTGKKRLKIT
ncbi:restriction endonuclease subunit S [Ilyomonas limi]|uniref:Restriction endonuclease subunit S n=1 Tax=Ilyomonas limi TaxID=2575867 RepID=A0A4U3KVH9_9BACT|nr:restriction endonuclease subunit S [Ilyomonas limi]TKK66352.1 restriction endonuclease subunit S [Ilyomonas limi]